MYSVGTQPDQNVKAAEMRGHLERKESQEQKKRKWKIGGQRSRGQRLYKS